ncbi:MAG: hypothetical protein WBW78_05960 [Terrimicrobiaceae bacterium]
MKALVALFFFTAILGAQDIELTGYTLVFEDNFDTLSLVQGDCRVPGLPAAARGVSADAVGYDHVGPQRIGIHIESLVQMGI